MEKQFYSTILLLTHVAVINVCLSQCFTVCCIFFFWPSIFWLALSMCHSLRNVLILCLSESTSLLLGCKSGVLYVSWPLNSCYLYIFVLMMGHQHWLEPWARSLCFFPKISLPKISKGLPIFKAGPYRTRTGIK